MRDNRHEYISVGMDTVRITTAVAKRLEEAGVIVKGDDTWYPKGQLTKADIIRAINGR